jgi:ribosomal protein L44E
MTSYRGDPYWLNARFDSFCKKCNKKIKKGSKIFYYPRSKSAYCEECGKHAEKDFRNMAEAEDYYSGRG